MDRYLKLSRRVMAVLVGLALSVASANAANPTWTGGGADSNWFNSANWNSGTVPSNGDSVTISSGGVILTNSTAQLSDFTISITNFVFTNWTTALRATNVTVQASGGFTHAPCDTNAAIGNTNRVYIICSNLTVLGSINVTALGFRGATNAVVIGQGPGGSAEDSAGSYGGLGGLGTALANDYRGPVYGSSNAPSDPGSGGGGRASNEQGGHGGGAVWIDASGRVVVSGTISADGLSRGNNAAGGSGGSICINCNTFASTNGNLRAQGGDTGSSSGHTGRGGGGGRIAVNYDLTAQQALNLTDRPLLNVYANGGFGYNGQRSGEPGTVYLSDASFFPPTNNTLHGGSLIMAGFSTWAPDSLTIASGRAVFPAGFTLTVTNDLVISGTGAGLQSSNTVVTVGRDLVADVLTPSMLYGGPRSALAVGRDFYVKQGDFSWYGASTNTSVLSVGRNCVVTNGGTLSLYADQTNSAVPDYGAQVTVGGNLIVATNSWVLPYSHWTNGGSVHIEAAAAAVQFGGGIDADAKGFGSRTWALDYTVKWGYGYGPGYSCGGAGYGGAGGPGDPANGGAGTAGITYGSSNAPADPGSGGGCYGGYAGGRGGGLVWLNVQRTITVDGDIRARGNVTPTSPYDVDVGGGGSGGGIYIRCKTLSGSATGRILADGGVPHFERPAWSGGSGGGGRIAVWCQYNGYLGANSVAAGQAANGLRTGTAGTVVWGLMRAQGTIFVVH